MNEKRLQFIHDQYGNTVLPVKPGMRLEIHETVWDADNQRIWKFRGLVLKVKKPNHPDGSFLIRWETARMTIEKIYPLSFPNFAKVILLDQHKVRQSKLYFMRDKVGKAARLKSIVAADKKNTNLLDGTITTPSVEAIDSTAEAMANE